MIIMNLLHSVEVTSKLEHSGCWVSIGCLFVCLIDFNIQLLLWLRTSGVSVQVIKLILSLDSVSVFSLSQNPVLDHSTSFLAVTSPQSAHTTCDSAWLSLDHLHVLKNARQVSCGLLLGS